MKGTLHGSLIQFTCLIVAHYQLDLILYQNLKYDFHYYLNEYYVILVYIMLVIWPSCQNHHGSDFGLQEENDQIAMENEAELMKSLNKQRQRAIAAARRGRKTLASRNSYKDKGGRSSHNSKIQKQLSSW